jgi:hypothetical protein
MNHANPKYLLADAEECAAWKRQNDLYLYEEDLANMREWRYKKCESMLAQINAMLLKELKRRIAEHG